MALGAHARRGHSSHLPCGQGGCLVSCRDLKEGWFCGTRLPGYTYEVRTHRVPHSLESHTNWATLAEGHTCQVILTGVITGPHSLRATLAGAMPQGTGVLVSPALNVPPVASICLL